MKRKIVVLSVLVIAGVCVWWFTQPASAPVREKVATASKAPAPLPPVPPSSAQVVAPKAAPVVYSQEQAASASTSSVAPVADPQADLKTVFPHLAGLIRSGDLMAYTLAYTPPGKLTPEAIQQLQQLQDRNTTHPLPALQQSRERAAEAWEALESQTPTFNEAGDEATYMLTISGMARGIPGITQGGTQVPRTFIKIDGKWYLKSLP